MFKQNVFQIRVITILKIKFIMKVIMDENMCKEEQMGEKWKKLLFIYY